MALQRVSIGHLTWNAFYRPFECVLFIRVEGSPRSEGRCYIVHHT